MPCSVTDNLARTHWEKLVWNIPFNGLGVAATAGFDVLSGRKPLAAMNVGETQSTDKLLASDDGALLVRKVMLEVIAVARALGFDLSDSLAGKNIERTQTMGAYKASTLLDFERGLPLELESLFLEPLRQARKANVPVPHLERLCEVLRKLDEAKRAGGKSAAG